MKYIHIKNLSGKSIYIPQSTFSSTYDMKMYICNIYTYIEPYRIRVCINGLFLDNLDKLSTNSIIHVWQLVSNDTRYRISDVFDALAQINGVLYTYNFSELCNCSDSDESFYSANESD